MKGHTNFQTYVLIEMQKKYKLFEVVRYLTRTILGTVPPQSSPVTLLKILTGMGLVKVDALLIGDYNSKHTISAIVILKRENSFSYGTSIV